MVPNSSTVPPLPSIESQHGRVSAANAISVTWKAARQAAATCKPATSRRRCLPPAALRLCKDPPMPQCLAGRSRASQAQGKMKVTVLHGKRTARLEVPATTTLTELAEGLAERFSLPDPSLLKFRLQEGQPSLRVRDYPEATLESAGAELVGLMWKCAHARALCACSCAGCSWGAAAAPLLAALGR